MQKLLFLLFISLGVNAQTINTNIQNTSICFGGQASVTFSATGFTTGTTYKVQLLDKDGGTVLYDNVATGSASPINFTADNIRTGAYTIKVMAVNTITINSVASSGLLFVGPYAKLSNNSGTTSDVTTVLGDTTNLKVNLYGTAPWVFTYSDGTFQHSVKTSTNPYFLKVLPNQNTRYSLIKVTNSCGTNGNIDDRVNVLINQPTSLTLPNPLNFNICGGGSVKIPLNYTGVWTNDVSFRVLLTDTSGLYIPNSEQIYNYKADTINYLLPKNLIIGKDYKIRIIVSKPYLLLNYLNSTYKLTATANNCVPLATIIASEPSCAGSFLQAFPKDSTGTYSYQWFKNNISIPTETRSNIFTSDSAQYHVYIFKNGYSSISNKINILQKKMDHGLINSNPIACTTGETVTLIASSNTPNTQYFWSGNNTIGGYPSGNKLIANQNNSSLNINESGNYSVIIQNKGCESFISLNVGYGNSANILATLTNQDLIGNANYYAGNERIFSIQNLNPNTNTLYNARLSIELKPGFSVEKSAVFKAEIAGCPVIPDTVIYKPNVFVVPDNRAGDIISIIQPVSNVTTSSKDNSVSKQVLYTSGILEIVNNPLNLQDYTTNTIVYSLPKVGYPIGYAYKIINRFVSNEKLTCEIVRATMTECVQVINKKIDLIPNINLNNPNGLNNIVYSIEDQVNLNRPFLENPEPYKEKTEVGFTTPDQGKIKLTKEGSKLILNYAIYDFDENYETEDDQVDLVFSVEINEELSNSSFLWTDPQLTFSGLNVFSLTGGLEYKKSFFDGQEALTEKVKSLKKLLLNKKIKLLRIPLGSSPAGILAQPYFDFYANFNLSLDGSLTLSAKLENVSFQYELKNQTLTGIYNPLGWSEPIADLKLPSPKLEVKASVEGSLDLGLAIGLTVDFPVFKLADDKESFFGIYSDINFNATVKSEISSELSIGSNPSNECNFTLERSINNYNYFEAQLNLKDVINWKTKKDITKPIPLLKFPTVNYPFCETAPLADPLVAKYTFTNSLNDESQFTNHLINNGADKTTDAKNIANSAYYFDGIADYLTTTATYLPADYSNRTISLWFKTDGVGYSQNVGTILDYGDWEANKRLAILIGGVNSNFGKGRIVISNLQSDVTDIAGKDYADNKWHHLVLKYNNRIITVDVDQNEVIKYNLTLLTSTEQTPLITNLHIGRNIANSNGVLQSFKGSIDQIRIYSKALTTAEIFVIHAEEAPPAPDLETGLVVHYKFENNYLDETENNNDGTQSGGVTFEQGRNGAGLAAKFDGVDDWIISQDNINISGNTNRTISVWINSQNVLDAPNIVGWGAYSAIGDLSFVKMHLNPKRLVFHSHFNDITAEVILLDNQWYNVVFKFENGVGKIFLNGDLIISQNKNLNTTSNQLKIGWDNLSGSASGWGQPWKGYLDDIRIYNRALTDEEVLQLFNEEKPTETIDLESGIVAYYPFNGNANDEAGDNDGVVNGATLTTDRFGNSGNAYSFDGNDVINSTSSSNILGNSPRTYSAWFKIGQNSNMTILKGGTNGTGNDFTLILNVNVSNQIQLYVRRFYDDVPSEYSAFNIGEWNNLIVTYDGTTTHNMKFYINGNLINTLKQFGNLPFNTASTNWTIGNYVDQANNNAFFNGKLDDIRIYERALNSSEVKALYNIEKP